MAPKYNQFIFFVRTETPFSQWHPAEFTMGGVTYNCAEQFMMASKADLFGDEETKNLILGVTLAKGERGLRYGMPGFDAEAWDAIPRRQKELGRAVKNFDPVIWDRAARHLVFEGSYGKFTQNPHLWEQLKATEGKQLVEAAHYDKVWGIGLRATDPDALDSAKWRGTNWLGETLTELRDLLIAHNFDPTNPFRDRPFENPYAESPSPIDVRRASSVQSTTPRV